MRERERGEREKERGRKDEWETEGKPTIQTEQSNMRKNRPFRKARSEDPRKIGQADSQANRQNEKQITNSDNDNDTTLAGCKALARDTELDKETETETKIERVRETSDEIKGRDSQRRRQSNISNVRPRQQI